MSRFFQKSSRDHSYLHNECSNITLVAHKNNGIKVSPINSFSDFMPTIANTRIVCAYICSRKSITKFLSLSQTYLSIFWRLYPPRSSSTTIKSKESMYAGLYLSEQRWIRAHFITWKVFNTHWFYAYKFKDVDVISLCLFILTVARWGCEMLSILISASSLPFSYENAAEFY